MIKRKAKKKKDLRGRPAFFETTFNKAELKEHNLYNKIDVVTVKVLHKAIKRCKGSITEISKLIGVDRSYAHRLLVKFKLREMCRETKS